MNPIEAMIFILLFVISMVVGYLDFSTFGGSTNFLNPAAAFATVVAFILIVIYDKNYGRLYKSATRVSVLVAVVLDAMRIISLVGGLIVPRTLKLSLAWLGLLWVEDKSISLFATRPEVIGPEPFVAKALALDPVPLIILGYYIIFKKKA